jgi:hypothetical protein
MPGETLDVFGSGNLEPRLARELALDSSTLAAAVEQRHPISSLFHGVSLPRQSVNVRRHIK